MKADVRYLVPVFPALLVAPLLAFGTETVLFTGTAANPQGNTLYTEHHKVAGTCREGQWWPRQHTVNYRKPGTDEPFASKQLDYRSGLLVPDMVFRQPDFGEVMAITLRDDRVSIDWQTPTGDAEQFSVVQPETLVIDAGFDHFIRSRWSTLTGGDNAGFRFLGPTRGDHYGFVAEPADTGDFEAEHEFRIRPTGWVTRFLVEPIYLGYDAQGFLTDFSGLTNIRQDPDRNFTAHIRYQRDNPAPCQLIP